MPNIADVVKFLEEFAPRQLAASWDNVGLLLGDAQGPCHRIMTCLTVTPESVEEACAQQAALIVSHHPIFFRPTQRLTSATSEGAMIWKLARAGIAVYSPHTAFDNAREGINARLVRRLGLLDALPLRSSSSPGACKIVVFAPDTDLEAVSRALFEAGAGEIGAYRQCSFRLEGTGTFYGLADTNPSIGKKEQREEVREWRLETVCPEAKVAAAIRAMRQAHSYEEPAFDIYRLREETGSEGEGRVGVLPAPMTLSKFAALVREKIGSRCTQIVGDPERQVERVALACGAAGEFLSDAVRVRADVFVTGEIRFHDCLSAQAQNLGVVLPGHFATERFAVEELALVLRNAFPDLEVWASQREQDPLQLV